MDAQKSRRQRLNELLETTKGKTYFVVFVTFGFTALMILMGLLPSYSAFVKQLEQNQRRAEHITNLKGKLSVMEDLVVENQEKEAIKNIFNKIMPNGFNQVDYVLEIEEFARTSGLGLNGLTFAISDDVANSIPSVRLDDKVRGMMINIQLDGDREALPEFILDLENSIRLYTIKDLTSIRKSDGELAEDGFLRPYRFTLLVETYYFDTQVQDE